MSIRSLFAGLLLAAVTEVAAPCCSVAEGDERVTIANQKNIIVWDEDGKTEHFFRVASFETASDKFGFIAPTPTIPDISEGDPKALDFLASLKPKASTGLQLSCSKDQVKSEAGVAVIKTVETENFEAAVLKASDVQKLQEWLVSNKFRINPEIRDWLDFYIKKNWYLTAFKYKSTDGQTLSPMARISFKTDQPFNPYYVPKANRSADPSGLSLFLISNKSYRGKVGSAEWRTSSTWETGMTHDQRQRLAKVLSLPVGAIGSSLQHFQDDSFPNRADVDITFDAVPIYGSLAGPVATGAGIAAIAAALARRRRRQALLK